MKKYRLILLCILASIMVIGCGTKTSSVDSSPTSSVTKEATELCILTLNDFHGALEADSTYRGMAKVATTIKQYRNSYTADKTIVLCAGDSFQGSIVSNLSEGLAVVNCMNAIGFDQMTIGNHEFDWGIDKIAKYNDGDESNGEANFPFGSANIYTKSTNQLLDWVDEYTIIEKSGYKIGIIPTIGYNLESSILGTRVADYTFKEPVQIIKDLSKKLRSEENCDIIIVNSHDDGSYINEKIAEFPSESKVDAVINAHSHYCNDDLYTRSGMADLATVQAGSSGSYIGMITLRVDPTQGVTKSTSKYVSVSTSTIADAEVQLIVDKAVEAIAPISNVVLAKLGENITEKSKLYTWVGNVIQRSMDCDIGITNTGGIRSIGSGFLTGWDFTVGDLYMVMPFDNMIMSTQITGAKYKEWVNKYSGGNIFGYRSGLSYSTLEDDKLYTICIIDYLSEKDYNAEFFQNSTYKTTGYVLRDLMQIDIQKDYSTNGSWKPSNGGVITPSDLIVED